MQTVEINERAMTCALDYTVGEEARKDIIVLYDLLHAAERTGREEGAASEQARANDYWNTQLEQIESRAWFAGYDVGHAIATSDEQPDVDYPCDVEPTTYYEGDSGDECDAVDEDYLDLEHKQPPYSVSAASTVPQQQQPGLNPWAWSPGPNGALVSKGPTVSDNLARYSTDADVVAMQREYDAAFKK